LHQKTLRQVDTDGWGGSQGGTKKGVTTRTGTNRRRESPTLNIVSTSYRKQEKKNQGKGGGEKGRVGNMNVGHMSGRYPEMFLGQRVGTSTLKTTNVTKNRLDRGP